MANTTSLEQYFSGKKLIGDDYCAAEIEAWFEDEREAYADLGAKNSISYIYNYHALNRLHGFRYLESGRRFEHACGFGSAYGDELLPMSGRIERVTLIDSSSCFSPSKRFSQPVSRVLARADGRIDVQSESFDLITCFGVLHHVPNVSFVISELVRCLTPGGVLLVREPTTSMGDWTKPRRGVTKRERGIPSSIFEEILSRSGLQISARSACVFPPVSAIFSRLGLSAYRYSPIVRLDHFLCSAMRWNYKYHRTTLLDRFAPASEFFVCCKAPS